MDAQKQARAGELMEELAELLSSAENHDGSWKTLDQIEIAANDVGDQFSTLLAQKTIDQSKAAKPAAVQCPKCSQPGCRLDEPDPRVVQIARGEIQWNEDEYFCRKCRKSFFPSDGPIGTQG